MKTVTVDFSNKCGVIKPMHAVNNGPVHKYYPDQRISNLDLYREAGIPFARNHDASFYDTYGGDHTVDIHAVFPNFDADPCDENSYDFTLTDEYIRVTDLAGTKTFYRLGTRIEHEVKKYHIFPPKDYKKWAVVCEHIILHYTEGWNNGFFYDMPYWEIWNEPDIDEEGAENQHCWGGTKKEFFSFFNTVASYLKNRFPKLKIGGPALCWNVDYMREFLENLTVKIDFFSWHFYNRDPKLLLEAVCERRQILDEYGFQNTESILDEWNYVRGWQGDDWIFSLDAEKNIIGAAYEAACMCGCQNLPLDMLMYYDARPCSMNGMFDSFVVSRALKGYYPFRMFHELYKIGTQMYTETDHAAVYATAAGSDKKAALMLSCFDDENCLPEEKLRLALNHLPFSTCKAKFYLLDETHNMELMFDEWFTSSDLAAYVTVRSNTVWLIVLEAEEF